MIPFIEVQGRHNQSILLEVRITVTLRIGVIKKEQK